jgi:predicted metal-dependent enzyme (double-stranded beta helix superfamily)
MQATPLDDGRQMLLMVDQQNRTLAIYHVDPAAGTLTLKSTRDVRWDLMVEDFNCQEPRPSALKKMLEMPK